MKTIISLLAAGFALLSAGCRDESVTSYRVRREAPVANLAAQLPDAHPPIAAGAPAAPADMAGPAVQTAAGAALTWTAPASWISKPATAMRKGSYTVPGEGGEADLSITAFPGAVGGELANLNRWRNQLQLPPLTEGEVAATVRRERRDGLEFTLVDLTAAGEKPAGMLGAMVPVGNTTWFFKLSGPAALLAREKPAFLSFLQTVHPAAP